MTGVTELSLVSLCLHLMDFFEWNPATRTRGHAFELYERN